MKTSTAEQERSRKKLQGFLEDKLKWHAYTHLVVADEDMDPASWFIHTIGRARAEQPEFIITGTMDHNLAMDLIADVAAYTEKNGVPKDGSVLGDQVRVPVVLRDVGNPFVLQHRVAQASSRFGGDIGVVQIVWADAAGRFPDDSLYDQSGSPQQMLWEQSMQA